MNPEQALNNRKAERNKQDVEVQEELIKHPYCGIIPSPDKLERSYNVPGEDLVNTRKDFEVVFDWLKSKFPNAFFSKDIEAAAKADKHLDAVVFKSAIRFAFQAFDSIRHNTGYPEAEQMVLLYYTGHGLSEEGASELKTANPNGMSSSPLLEKVGYTNPEEYFSDARDRTVKGGELCLHEVGYCDLRGLLQPWIAAVKQTSTNPDGIKKKKHLVIIADSCYSGKLVDDLTEIKGTIGPWNKNDCTVTVQSACSSGEVTLGGYFTPCFVHYSKNQEELQLLIGEWNKNSVFVKNAYREINLPSPQLETTGSLPEGADDSPVLMLSFQGFDLRLFRDPGFFKFCYVKYSGALGPPRALNGDTVNTLLENPARFDILDYKLKTMAINDTPLALVLVDNPADNEHVICVHIHFRYRDNTELDNVSRVNLVEHERPEYPSLLFLGVSETGPKLQLNPREDADRYEALVRQCKEYVENKQPGRWRDISWWNMRNNQLGVNHMFRMQERSAWMNQYLQEVAQNAAN